MNVHNTSIHNSRKPETEMWYIQQSNTGMLLVNLQKYIYYRNTYICQNSKSTLKIGPFYCMQINPNTFYFQNIVIIKK